MPIPSKLFYIYKANENHDQLNDQCTMQPNAPFKTIQQHDLQDDHPITYYTQYYAKLVCGTKAPCHLYALSPENMQVMIHYDNIYNTATKFCIYYSEFLLYIICNSVFWYSENTAKQLDA